MNPAPLTILMSHPKNCFKHGAIRITLILGIKLRQPREIIGVHAPRQKNLSQLNHLFRRVSEHVRAALVDVNVAPLDEVVHKEYIDRGFANSPDESLLLLQL